MTTTYLCDADPDWLAAATDLVETTRDLMLSVAVTELPAAELREVRRQVADLAARLGSTTRPRALRPRFDEPRLARAQGPDGAPYPVSVSSPHALPLQVRFDGDPGVDRAHAVFVANALHEGPPEMVHGGVSAWLMDTMLGVLVQSTGEPCVTGTLEIRYLRRTPLDLHAEIVSRSGRKLVVEGWIEIAGVRHVEARGLFVQVPMAVPN